MLPFNAELITVASRLFSQSTDVTSTDLILANGKTKEVYCCDIVVLIVLFSCFWCGKDYNTCRISRLYWNIVWWNCETISISWLLFSPLPKLGQLTSFEWLTKRIFLVLWMYSLSSMHFRTPCAFYGQGTTEVPVPVSKCQLCKGSHALDTASRNTAQIDS